MLMDEDNRRRRFQPSRSLFTLSFLISHFSFLISLAHLQRSTFYSLLVENIESSVQGLYRFVTALATLSPDSFNQVELEYLRSRLHMYPQVVFSYLKRLNFVSSRNIVQRTYGTQTIAHHLHEPLTDHSH